MQRFLFAVALFLRAKCLGVGEGWFCHFIAHSQALEFLSCREQSGKGEGNIAAFLVSSNFACKI